MAKRKKARKAGASLKALVNPRLMKGLEHVLRQHILMTAVQREVSPKEAAELLGEGLGNVSYHIRVLRDECGLIEETRRERRRGSVEHYYRATVKTLLPAQAFRGLKGGLRAAVGACMADDLLDDLAGALEAGKLEGRHDHLARLPLVLDEEGERKVFAIAQRARRDVECEQQKAACRMSDRGAQDEGKGFAFAVFAFEAAWSAAGVDELAAGGSGT